MDNTTVSEDLGSFTFTARTSYYGTQIKPPIELSVRYEMYHGRPVFREALDHRGLSHEIEQLNQEELRAGFDEHHIV